MLKEAEKLIKTLKKNNEIITAMFVLVSILEFHRLYPITFDILERDEVIRPWKMELRGVS